VTVKICNPDPNPNPDLINTNPNPDHNYNPQTRRRKIAWSRSNYPSPGKENIIYVGILPRLNGASACACKLLLQRTHSIGIRNQNQFQASFAGTIE